MAEYYGGGLESLMGDTGGLEKFIFSGDSPEDRANKMLLMMNRLRELEGPSPRERFEAERMDKELAQRREQINDTMSRMTELIKDSRVTDATKDYVRRQMETLYTVLTPVERLGVAPWIKAQFMNPDEAKARWFEKMYPKPMPPLGADHVPLPRTAENRQAWAQYDWNDILWRRLKMGTVYGTEMMEKSLPLPTMLPAQAAEDDPGAQIYSYRNRLTGTLGFLDLKAEKTGDVAKALELGQTIEEIADKGRILKGPRADTFVGDTLVKVSPYRDMFTGEDTFERISYGKGREQKPIRDEFNDAVDYVNLKINGELPDDFKMNEPTSVFWASQLEKFSKDLPSKGPERAKWNDAFLRMQEEFRQASGGWVPIRRPEEVKENWFFPGYTMEGGLWALRRTSGMRPFRDSSGKIGYLWWDDANDVGFDQNGNDVQGTKGAQAGEQLNAVVFGEEARKETPKKAPLKVGGPMGAPREPETIAGGIGGQVSPEALGAASGEVFLGLEEVNYTTPESLSRFADLLKNLFYPRPFPIFDLATGKFGRGKETEKETE